MSIDYDFVHDAACAIDKACGGSLTPQQFNDVELICNSIAWNEHGKTFIDKKIGTAIINPRGLEKVELKK